MKQYDNITQGNDDWHHIRKGKITGTTLKAIMGTPKARQEAIYELIGERLTLGVETDYENAMDRGLRLENEAITAFEFETGKQVEKTGFCEDENNAMICNSPDGLIGKDEAIEIKCMGAKNHVKMWLTNKIPNEYEAQTLQYFVVNDKLKKLYFVAYNPDIPLHPLHTIEFKREDIAEDIAKARSLQEKFLLEVEAEMAKIIEL